MKSGIHPQYAPTQITCTCGNTFVTRTTETGGAINVEVCSNCHPFYTGKQKILDTGGRVARFQQRYAKQEAAKIAAEKAKRDAAKAEPSAAGQPAPKTAATPEPKASTPVKLEATPMGKVDVENAPTDAIGTEVTDEAVGPAK